VDAAAGASAYGESVRYPLALFAFVGAWLALRERSRAAREREGEARVAAAEERARIGRELHDLVAHSVSVMVVQAGAVRSRLEPQLEGERRALLTVERTGREALADMRRLLGVIRAEGEDAELAPQPGLGDVAALIDSSRRDGRAVKLRIEGTPRQLSPVVDVSAYRIIENAIRTRTPAEVVLRYDDGAVVVEIVNDGVGPHESGLAALRERVELLGGEVEAGARRGGGHVLRARLPVRMGEP
jgi:signal transduction histidine kinase